MLLPRRRGFAGLAARLQLPQLAFARAEEIWAYQLEGTGIRLKDFERNGIAVLTDGIENASSQKDVFACLPTGEDVEGVKVFTIAYGKDADAKLLKQIAERTNGKTFSGDPATIEQVYLAISAEQ